MVTITLLNASTHALDQVHVKWEGPRLVGGILSPGIGSTAVDAPWFDADRAIITFVDDLTRKPYQIAVTFVELNKLALVGQCEYVTFRILDYDKAEVVAESPFKNSW